MLQKQLSEIFRVLAHGRRSYGGFVRLNHESEVSEGLRLVKMQAESAIGTLRGQNDIHLSKVTYITLLNDNEVLAAWFFTVTEDENEPDTISKYR